MTEDEFVRRVFEIAAHHGLTVEDRRPGKSICFNPVSNKWLSEGHIRSLFPLVLTPGLSEKQMNQMVEEVAPGRPCTHVGFRKIIRQFHDECGWVPGAGI